ncbi:MAG: GDSL-type esterase/lipase family protein [Acidobacteriaceae bacterium]
MPDDRQPRYRAARARLLINLLVGTMAAAVAGSAVAQRQAAGPWVGTWATAAMRDGSELHFHNQTLRQTVHVSVGGTRARVRISNLFGTRTLVIDDVRLALHANGSAIDPASDREVEFSGRTRVAIDPGSTVTSDPVVFRVPPLADLAISLYATDFSGPATFHAWAHQTNYLAAGDQAGEPALKNAKPIGASYFLSGIDVWNPNNEGAIVALGASITEGFKAEDDHRWTDDLAERLARAGLPIGVLNLGISGNRLLADGVGASAASRFQRDVLDQTGVRWVIFSDDPINDLGMTRPPPTGDELIAAIRALIARAHARRLQFLCSTLTPFEGAGYWSGEEEISRGKVNAFLRSKASGCDSIVDQDGATHDPAHPALFLPADDGGDHLHPSNAGHAAIARAVPLEFLASGGTGSAEKSAHR